MKPLFVSIQNTVIAMILSAAIIPGGGAFANTGETSVSLLTANFEQRHVVQVEVGDFHFAPGQVAPIHTHTAPAIGYVAKGMIIYQLENGKPQILRAGDAFFEPSGTRVLRFDNASATEEAIFIDFNLEQRGEPFIVFEEQPTQHIDRRTLPTVELGDAGKAITQTEVFATELAPGASIALNSGDLTLGLVAEGVIEFRPEGEVAQRIVAGGTFTVPTNGIETTLTNGSVETSAKVITFRLR